VLTHALKTQVLETVQACYDTAERVLKREFSVPNVLFNQRGRIAGCAILQKNTLKFHPLLLQQNQAHFLTHVVPHEVAHLLVWQLYGKTAPHGREWQNIMVSVFNLPPHRTHQYNVDNIGIKSINYNCDCGVVPLTIRRHNKALKGAVYRCRTCHQDLQLSVLS